MIQAYFNGLSGLLSFSKGLKSVSANVSNMNTPGFRGSDTFFRNVGTAGDGGIDNIGVDLAGTGLRTVAGELRQSGNTTDMAIDGRGFFILQDSGGGADNYIYTRAGQFRFDAQHVLIDSVTGRQVMALGAGNQLVPLDISSQQMLPPVATTEVDFSGNLVPGSATHAVQGVTVFDSAGTQTTLTLTFTENSATQANTWLVDVSSSALGSIGNGTLTFGADGTPSAGKNTFDITLTNGGNTQNITLNFGTPGGIGGATQYSGASSSLAASVKDGSAMSAPTTMAFNDSGVLTLTYANGKKIDGPQVALASFADESSLVENSHAQFSTGTGAADIGAASTGAFGKIRGGFIELSNVDLAQEFGDLLIIQRGYQASSRVMTVASEMIEQLYSNSRN